MVVGLYLCPPNIKAEKTQRFCHPAIHRRAFFGLDRSVQLKRAETAKEAKLYGWIVQAVVKPLDELTGAMQKIR